MAVTTGRPGVFVSESLNPLVNTPQVPGQAVAALVGTHSAGPVGPTLVSSWADFTVRFGGFGDGSSYLPHAVYQYFANGGSQMFLVRAVAADAAAASVVLNDLQAEPAPVLTLTAQAPGTVGNDLLISITNGTPNSGRFNVFVRVGSADAAPVEQYMDVSLDPADRRNFVAMVGAASGSGSRYIAAEYTGPAAWSVEHTPAAQTNTPLAAGANGASTPDLVAATQLLDSVEQILNVNLPGVSDPVVLNPLLAWAASSNSRFLVVDAPQASDSYEDTVKALRDLSPLGTSGGTPLTRTSYGAVYGPWLAFRDPSSQAVGATRVLPPGGAMLGLMAQADMASGTQQSAAGVAFPVQGALSAETRFANADLDTLNQLGINIIRSMPGATGLVPLGGRTLASGMPDQYISIRRTLMYISRLCIESTNFAVFRPNNEDLWGQLTSLLTDQLSTLQQAGVLRGATASEAFYVLCDATNNTENSVANGIVNIEVGVSLNTPAEFIVIKIGQMASGATSEDSLTS